MLNRPLLQPLVLIFLFSCTTLLSNAQSATSDLEQAERFFKNQKYTEAHAVYKKHGASLNTEHQLHYGMTFLALSGCKDEQMISDGYQWMLKAADKGNTEAMNTLSACYSTGLCIQKDSVKSLAWLEKSANLGDDKAMVALGYAYQTGKGASSDKLKARTLYTKAADKGNKDAMYYLGAMESDGGNMSSALFYLKKAATYGSMPAMLKLGQLYEEGRSMPVNTDEALRWYKQIKARSGYTTYHSQANDRIREIESTPPPADINTVKPLLLKLIMTAGSEFGGLISQEIDNPDRSYLDDMFGKTTYYTSTVDLGFKNALIKKEVMDGKKIGDVQFRKGTFYTYSADVIASANQEDAARVYDQWVRILKQTVPQWEGREEKDPNNNSPYYSFSGYLTNGKKVSVKLMYCCPARNSGDKIVSLQIKSN